MRGEGHRRGGKAGKFDGELQLTELREEKIAAQMDRKKWEKVREMTDKLYMTSI